MTSTQQQQSPVGKVNPDGSVTTGSVPGWVAEWLEIQRKEREEAIASKTRKQQRS